MAVHNNKKCLMCGEVYSYCPSCSEFAQLPKWMTMFHGQGCKDLFDTLSRWNYKHITTEEARQAIKNIDMPEMSRLTEKIRAEISEIMNEPVEVSVETDTPVIERTNTRKRRKQKYNSLESLMPETEKTDIVLDNSVDEVID